MLISKSQIILCIFYIKEVYSSYSSIPTRNNASTSEVSSFPTLTPSEIPSIVLLSTSEPKSEMMPIPVSLIDNLFIKFVFDLMPAFGKTCNGLQNIMDQMETMTPIQQIYEIPTLISNFTSLYTHLENSINKKLLDLSNIPPLKAPYVLVPPTMFPSFISAVASLNNSTANIINLLNQLKGLVNNQLNHLKLGPKKHTIIMTINQANKFDTVIENLGTQNENIQKAFQEMAHLHQEGLMRNQNNTEGKQLISADLNWFNNMDAVFMQIYPQIYAFANAIINDGVTNTKTGTFTVSISALNASIRGITEELIHLIKILGDYFEIYEYGLVSLKKELESKS